MPSKFKFKARPRGKRSMGAGGSRSKVRGFRSKRKEEPKQTQNLSSGAKAAGSIAKQIVDKALGATEKAAANVAANKKKQPWHHSNTAGTPEKDGKKKKKGTKFFNVSSPMYKRK
tara:strand:+ start:187 stop:531 length:345 start_codon:yes stop_codon:yes gene_type:complete